MEFEWDPDKREINLHRHGIDFEDTIAIWEGPVLEVPSEQTQHGEVRVLATGLLVGRMVTVVFTWRGDVRRIISARAARTYEREDYKKATGRETSRQE